MKKILVTDGKGLQLTFNWFETNKEFIKSDIYNV